MITQWYSQIDEPLIAEVIGEDSEMSVPLLIRKPITNVHHSEPTQYIYFGKYRYHFGAQMFIADGKKSYYFIEDIFEWCYLYTSDQSEHNYLMRIKHPNRYK